MKTIFKRYLLPLLTLMATCSCNKSVQVSPPITQLVTTSVFASDATATAAQLAIYAQLVTNGDAANMIKSTGLASDELYTYSTNATLKNLYANALITTDASVLSVNEWTQSYSLIYQANAILENLGGSEKITPAVKLQLMSESQFIRAYCYFNLVNIYGSIPLILSTDYKTNSALPRSTKSTVYQQIIADLKNAQNGLSNKFVDATDTVVTTERVRPTKWAAMALLARVYLYTGDWANAESQSSSLIVNNAPFNLSLSTDLSDVFKKNSDEAIWQLMTPTTLGYTQEGYYFVLSTSPITASLNNFVLSPQLLAAFENGDARRTKWVGNFTSGSNTWFFPNKYKRGNVSTPPSDEYSMVLRLSEQFLIRSEARAQQNNITGASGALTDLNVIRKRANLPAYAGLTDQTSILNAIAHERQIELFTENHRWFDLNRTGSIDAVMNTVTPQKGGKWNNYQKYFPIPLSDILNNINLTQTPGY